MKKNEQGSTLILVLLIILIFTVLGMSIISASLSGTKRTEMRENEVQTNLEAIKELNEAVAFIQSTIHENYSPDMSLTEYNDLINHIIASNYNIINVDSNLTNDFTRILQVKSTLGENESYIQKVYITGMPSFLKYALGSRDKLTLNGSIYLKEGNFYAKNGLTISATAKYIYNNQQKYVETSLPSVANSEKNSLFLEDYNVSYCLSNCYPNTGAFSPLPINKLQLGFDPNAPNYINEKSEFIDVHILPTFIEKLRDAGFINENIETKNLTENELLSTIKQIVTNGSSNAKVKTITKISNENNNSNDIVIENNEPGITGYLYKSSENSPAYIDTNNLVVDKTKWLVIDGDAYFENIGSNTMNISGNILVTGDVYMVGTLSFDSTMYVLGNTIINNVNISGNNGSELILMTQKNLELARVNPFNSSNFIQAFLYTASDAEVYAVGSYLDINGGLFAKGNLEVNAFRGGAKAGVNDIEFEPNTNYEQSRFIIKNNKKIFSNQEQGLPKVEKLEIIKDLMKKDRPS